MPGVWAGDCGWGGDQGPDREGAPSWLPLSRDPWMRRGLISRHPEGHGGDPGQALKARRCRVGWGGYTPGSRRAQDSGRGRRWLVPLGSCGQGGCAHGRLYTLSTGEHAGGCTGPCGGMKYAGRVPCGCELSPNFQSFGR